MVRTLLLLTRKTQIEISQARPVYLTLPTDLIHAKVSAERLRIPLTRRLIQNDPQVEGYVLDLITKQFAEAAGDAVVLVDACAIRHDARKELNDFLRKTGFPVYAAPMGKTAVDENYERYGGVRVLYTQSYMPFPIIVPDILRKCYRPRY